MQPITLTTIADARVFPYVRYQAHTIRNLGYTPSNSDYIIWDTGLTRFQASELSQFADVAPFDNLEYNQHIASLTDEQIIGPENMQYGPERARITRSSICKSFAIRELLSMNLKRIIYLDADAFFANPLLECNDPFLQDANFDVTLTLRSTQPGPLDVESDPGKWRFVLLNGGVQMFRDHTCIPFLDAHIALIKSNPVISDQGNMNRLINQCTNFNWMRYGTYTVTCNGVDIKVRLIKCGPEYNEFVNKQAPRKINGNGRLCFRNDPVIAHAKGQSKRRLRMNTWEGFREWLSL